MFEWKPDMVRFMKDASENSDYYEALAEHIVQALGGPEEAAAMHACDAGCGLGYLALALSRRFRRVTAVEIAEEPLGVLRGNVARLGIDNVEIHQADAWSCPDGVRFDAMIFCMFGSVEQALRVAQGHAGQIVMVKKKKAIRRFALDPGAQGRDSMMESADALKRLAQPCAVTSADLRLDQPIRTVQDGMRFFELYGCKRGEEHVTEQEALSRMRATGDATFPWVIPAHRELAILRIVPQQCG